MVERVQPGPGTLVSELRIHFEDTAAHLHAAEAGWIRLNAAGAA